MISNRGPAPPTQPSPLPSLRVNGTDGLLSRLPFGIPSDPPTIRSERTNRFTIDDVRVASSGYATTPPWVQRPGGPVFIRTGPYQR